MIVEPRRFFSEDLLAVVQETHAFVLRENVFGIPEKKIVKNKAMLHFTLQLGKPFFIKLKQLQVTFTRSRFGNFL